MVDIDDFFKVILQKKCKQMRQLLEGEVEGSRKKSNFI